MTRQRTTTKLPDLLDQLQTSIAAIQTQAQRHTSAVLGTIGIAAEYATEIAQMLPDARTRMTDALPGARTSSWNPTGNGTILDDQGTPMPTISDPTGEAAIRPDNVTGDRMRLAAALSIATGHAHTIATRAEASPLTEAHQCLDQTRQAWIIVQRWANRTATSRDRETTPNPPGCESCARDNGHWSPVDRTVTLLDGSRIPLCDWCRRRSRGTGNIPTRAEIVAHHQGRRVPAPPVT